MKSTLNIEVTNYCNGNCPVCLRRQFDGQPNYHLDYNVLINNLTPTILKQFNRITFYGASGEPSLYPQFYDIVRYLKDNGAKIEFTSNGDTRDDKWWFNLLSLLDESDTVGFCLDGHTKDIHKQYRGTNFDTVFRRIDQLYNSNAHKTVLSIMFNYNADSLFKLNKILKDKYPHIRHFIKPTHSSHGMFQFPSQEQIDMIYSSNIEEDLPFKTLDCEEGYYINADGTVTPCCFINTRNRELNEYIKQDGLIKETYYNQKNKMNIYDNHLSDIINNGFYIIIPKFKHLLNTCKQCVKKNK